MSQSVIVAKEKSLHRRKGMQKMKRLIVLGCLLLVCSGAWAEGITFNYEGRVKVTGTAYTGLGYFKFAIVNNNGQISYWSNDGTSTTGNEPASYIISDVTDGIFNVIIGDASVSGMGTLDPSMFNMDDKVFLRVWFSDTGSDFEQLHPDRRIANPALLGSQSLDELTLYVNPDTGDDRYTGLAADRPKQTVQAAWDALPPLIRSNATIQLASGVYREEVHLSGKTAIGDATITILGDPGNPGTVRVTGADEGADTTPVREFGFHISNQRSIMIQGVLVDYTLYTTGIEDAGIFVTEASSIKVKDCLLNNNRAGIWLRNSSSATVEDSTFTQDAFSLSRGVWAQFSSRFITKGCLFDGVHVGAGADRLSEAWIWGCAFQDCTTGVGVAMQSMLTFELPNSTIKRCDTGVNLSLNSVAAYANDRVDYGTGADANLVNTDSDGLGTYFKW